MPRFKLETEFNEIKTGVPSILSSNCHYMFTQGVYGKIPKDWQMKTIDEDYNVRTGERISPAGEGPFPVYGASGFSGYSKEFIADGEAVITGRVGSLGKIFYSYNKANISDNALYFTKKNDGAVLRFLYYALKVVFKNIDEVLNVGTSQPLVKQSEVKRFSIPFPDYTEQHRIVDLLSIFDDLIEKKKKQNESLEKTAIAIFKSWFVDFEPFVEGEFEDRQRGEMPKGWKIVPIGELAETRNGMSYKGKEKFKESTGYVFITLNNMIEGGGFKSEFAWIKSNRIKADHFLNEGDLVIANTHFGVGGSETGRLLGTPALVSFPYYYREEKGVYSHHITKIDPKDNKMKYFLYIFLRINKEETATFQTGTTVLSLDVSNFKRNKLVPLPDQPVLERFDSLVGPLFQKIMVNRKQIMVLQGIRDAILPLLVLGKLRVEEG